MEKTFTPLAGQSRQEREAAALEDRFVYGAAIAARSCITWNDFLSKNYEFRGLCSDAGHRAQFENFRSRALHDLNAGRKPQIDPAAEVEAIRSQRRAEYERQNMERRYDVLKDDLMKFAFDGKPWETVQRELLHDDASPWDRSLYQRACREIGIAEPVAEDQTEAAFKSGFYAE